MDSKPEYDLVEVFWSAQGEGPYVGRSTIFLRFGGCDLRCDWCDSPETWVARKECRIESAPGSGRFSVEPNPVSHERLAQVLASLAPRPGSFLSLTGGEPLLHPLGVIGAARIARELGMRVFLETHGLARDAMTEVAPSVDYVSMDWKLESDVRWADAEPSKARPSSFEDGHVAFLDLLVAQGVAALSLIHI